jgi:hypothetical protein
MEFINTDDSGKYSTKQKTALTEEEVMQYIAACKKLEGIKFMCLEKLPDKGEPDTIYLIPHGDLIKEFMWRTEENEFYHIGDIPIEIEEEQEDDTQEGEK